jgi:hypothetical protein
MDVVEVTQGGCALRFSRVILALALAGFATSVAMADAVDPTVIIRRVDPAFTPIFSVDQILIVTATAQNPIFSFQNDTGFLLTSMTLKFSSNGGTLAFSCGENPGADIFQDCSETSGPNGTNIVTFSGVGEGFSGLESGVCTSDDEHVPNGNAFGWYKNHPKTPNCEGGIFSLEFGQIPANTTIFGIGTVATPEPMTAVMLISGLAGLAGLRKRRTV